MANGQLTPKQQRFVEEYLIDLNATAAARRAGYAEANADRQAAQLLGNTRVSAAIAEAMRRRSERTHITQDDVLREWATLAFSDIGDILDFTGGEVRLKRPRDIPKAARRAISSMKVRREIEGRGDDARPVEVIEFKLWDKNTSLTNAAKHLNMLLNKVAPVNPDGTTPYDGNGAVAALLAELRERVERRRGEAGGAPGQPT